MTDRAAVILVAIYMLSMLALGAFSGAAIMQLLMRAVCQ